MSISFTCHPFDAHLIPSHALSLRYVHESEEQAQAAERGVSGRYVVARGPEEALAEARKKHGEVSAMMYWDCCRVKEGRR